MVLVMATDQPFVNQPPLTSGSSGAHLWALGMVLHA
jgi:hypothetical protein